MTRTPGQSVLAPARLLFALAIIVCFIRPCLAQISGEVESIGFDNYYRPTAWTPMVIRLNAQTDQSADYQVRVYQSDLDRDLPTFVRQISVTGSNNGAARDQRFRMYFRPTPVDQGLPDATDPGVSVATLQKKLSVELYTTNNKFVCELPITGTCFSVDHFPQRGTRFVLAASAGVSTPARGEYDGSTAGLLEDVAMIPVKTDALPENPIGYDGVDAVLWLDADPMELSSGGDEKLRALQNYVRNGGHLVICQPSEGWQKTLAFGDFLPVNLNGVRVKNDGEPLKSIATPQRTSFQDQDNKPDPWADLVGPTTLGVAQLKPGGIVDSWIIWAGDEPTPYIARKPYGCGCVTWVAQDLGDPNLKRLATSNWPVVWNRVFDWKDTPMNSARVKKDTLDAYTMDTTVVSVDSNLNGVTDLPGKGLGLVSLAVLSFIIYWLVAGPGTYFFLLNKHRTEASWFVFAVTAMVFTLLTALMVRLVLRGPAELKHFSLARTAGLDAVHVHSRLGLYIPRDGTQVLSLTDASPGTAPSLTALSLSPYDIHDQTDDIGQQYDVSLPDPLSTEPAVLRVPFRSTMKKFEATWTGAIGAGSTGGAVTGIIEGALHKTGNVSVAGRLTNGTGKNLNDVYVAYKWNAPLDVDSDGHQNVDSRSGDYLFYMPHWKAGDTIDLNAEMTTEVQQDGSTHKVPIVSSEGARPGRGVKCSGKIQRDWVPFWLRRSANFETTPTVDLDQSLIMLSLFSRMSVDKRTQDHNERYDLLRRGGHRYDVSPALAAGSAIVIASVDAQGESDLPLPLDLDGSPLKGSGSTLYQFIVPVDNGDTTPPTTQSSTQPNMK